MGADGAGGGGQDATRNLQGLLLMKIIHECHTEDRKHAELEMCDIGGGTTGHDTEPLPLYALPVLFHAIHHEESECECEHRVLQREVIGLVVHTEVERNLAQQREHEHTAEIFPEVGGMDKALDAEKCEDREAEKAAEMKDVVEPEPAHPFRRGDRHLIVFLGVSVELAVLDDDDREAVRGHHEGREELQEAAGQSDSFSGAF